MSIVELDQNGFGNDPFFTDHFRQYLDEIGQIPIISPGEVARCFQTAGNAASSMTLLNRLSYSIVALPVTSEPVANFLSLQSFCLEQQEAAKHKVIEGNLRLAVSRATKFSGRGLDLPDLVQCANLGLIRAWESFDYRLGFLFTTYATHWTEHFIRRAIADHSRTVRLPVHAARTLENEMGQLITDLGRYPTEAEIVGSTGLKKDNAQSALPFLNNHLASLDEPIDSLGGDTPLLLGETIADPTESVEDQASDHRFSEELTDRIQDLLPADLFKIISLRHGLNGDHPHTLPEIGLQFNVSRQRIEQKEKDAYRRLKKDPQIAKFFEGQTGRSTPP